MSIIHEALKKAQKTTEPRLPFNEIKDRSFTEPTPFIRGRRLSFGLILLTCILLAVTTILYLTSRDNHPVPNSVSITSLPRTTEKNQTMLPSSPVSKNLRDVQYQVLFDKGVVMLNSGNLSGAEKYFSEAVTLNPLFPEAHNGLGLIYKKQGEMEKAKEHYQNAIGLKSDYSEALNNLAVMLDQKGEFQKAQGLYQRALQHRPGYSDAHLNFAISLEKAGFLDKAKREYEHFLSSASPEQSGLVEKIKAHLRQL